MYWSAGLLDSCTVDLFKCLPAGKADQHKQKYIETDRQKHVYIYRHRDIQT